MTLELKAGEGRVRLIKDDITLLPIDAFVFYARHDLALGSGFGGAIAARGGPAVQKELKDKGPLETGQALASTAGELEAKRIIHAVGPRFQEPGLEDLLRKTMRSALACAAGEGLRKVAFPAMGAGFYGVPLPLCARVMLEEIRAHLEGDTPIAEVTVCVLDRREYEPFAEQFEAAAQPALAG